MRHKTLAWNASPLISTLPYELLREIFLLANPPVDRHPVRSIVTVAQVCRLWRAVAHDIPRLWTNIYWNAQARDRPAERARVAKQIALSGSSLPLRVHLSFPLDPLDPNYVEFNHVDLRDIVCLLRPIFPRVWSFSHQSKEGSSVLQYFMRLMCYAQIKMSSLQELVLIAHQDHSDMGVMLNRASPALRHLRLIGTKLPFANTAITNLVTLVLYFPKEHLKPPTGELRCFLQSTADTLEHLELQGVIKYIPALEEEDPSEESVSDALEEDSGSDTQGEADVNSDRDSTDEEQEEYFGVFSDTFDPTQAIVFPNLTKLHLGFGHPVEGVSLLKLIRAPKIQHLLLTDMRNVGPHHDENNDEALSNIVLRYLIHDLPLPLVHVKHLTLTGIHYRSSCNLGHTLTDSCPLLESISVVHCCPGFYAPMVRDVHARFDHSDVFFGDHNPALRSVHIVALNLSIVLFYLTHRADLYQREMGLCIVPLEELVIDYEGHNMRGRDVRATLAPHPAFAHAIRLRHFEGGTLGLGDARGLIDLQECEAGLLEDVPPVDVLELYYDTRRKKFRRIKGHKSGR
ncbi:hypothetical protein BV25DRAFT_1920763 [Artomyces pyxidatus]|uniref:Uncharacterized protein n=1 Tax=Artomyces pyxidatus TaxID=48021 RepID=A0ACB8SKI9_9AGAM|nr:hypothetical protein BV25DRAFT_1920763 [Artomyces pyxidatus]